MPDNNKPNKKAFNLGSSIRSLMNNLYTNTYMTSPKLGSDMAALTKDIDSSLDKITNANISAVGIPNISKLYTRAGINSAQSDTTIIKNIEDTKPFKILVDYIIYLKQEKKENYIIEFFERVIDIAVYELYFKEELHSKCFGILEVLESELISFDNSFETIERVYKKLSDKNHKVAYNVNFIDTLDIVKTIENK